MCLPCHRHVVSRPVPVCLVCLGNICRSPMADVVLRAEVDRAGLAGLVEVDSAGTATGTWASPWPSRPRPNWPGVVTTGPRTGRRIQPSWFAQRDLVLAIGSQEPGRAARPGPDAEAAGSRLMLFRSLDPDLAAATAHDPGTAGCPTPTAGRQGLRASPGHGRGRGAGPGGTASRGGPGPGGRSVTMPADDVPADDKPADDGAADPGIRAASRAPRLARRVSELARRLERITGTAVRDFHGRGAAPVGPLPGHAGRRPAFAEAARGDHGGVFEAEARGLRWLADAHAVPLPEVLGWTDARRDLFPQQVPDQHAAEQFGRDLAVLHASGAERFGTPWPGFIATLPLGDRSGDTITVTAEATAPGNPTMLISGAGDWAAWYASKRLLPYLRRAAGTGALTGSTPAWWKR